ncbi:MAG TPA: class I SAM-dependent methyltransferase [Pseudonocardia sp.]|jgi:SAM-dependent methyltransferase
MTEQHAEAVPDATAPAAAPAEVPEETERFWDDLYGAKEQVWSGRPNPVFAGIVERICPGRALDLGCGEGGDATWLAGRGWTVTGVDVSGTALQRTRALAIARGVEVRTERHDLTRTFPAGTFDLVSAQFLQSPLGFPRHHVLRAAAHALAPGGLLLVVDHGSLPPWSQHSHEHRYLPTPREVFDEIDLDPARWHAELMDQPQREVTGPGGQQANLIDNVLIVRRAMP